LTLPRPTVPNPILTTNGSGKSCSRHCWHSRTADRVGHFGYGDKRVYQEIARRLEQSTAGDPKALELTAYHVTLAARYGGNWAIPLAASLLSSVELHGMRRVNEQLQPFSSADESIEIFQDLIGKDFGYRRDAPVEERLAAIHKARDWWEREGRTRLVDEIAQDDPPAQSPGDLFLSDDELQAMADSIRGDKPEQRTRTLASLGSVYSHQLQRALLDTLDQLGSAQQQTLILALLEPRPALWHLPTLMRIFDRDGNTQVRVQAGRIIASIVGNPNWPRFEVREQALAQARWLAQNNDAPLAIREVAVSILISRHSFVDEARLRELGRDPQFGAFEPLRQYLVRTDEQNERWGPARVSLE
jgi:hypothetical protein